MKIIIFFIMIGLAAVNAAQAQKWNELRDEHKAMKIQAFRTDNQQYLKATLGMSSTQMSNIDNVNVCYLSTLDRIDRYAKTDSVKNMLAEAVSDARWVQLDAIMGPEKHKQYAVYLKDKIE